MLSHNRVTPQPLSTDSTLPTTFTGYTSPPLSPTGRQSRNNAASKRYKYLRRIFMFRQMDFQYAFWQMIYLFVAPQKVYRNFQYRKQTKDQWARDDPAFLVLLSLCLCGSTIVFSIVLGLSFWGFVKTLLWIVLVDCIGVGILVASVMWMISNRYLCIPGSRGYDVEWGYAFDVHLNAFFPLLVILHVVQLFFLHFIYNQQPDHFVSLILGNTHWLLAIGYYIYITFLGYTMLPFIKKTRAFLFPLMVLVIVYVLSLVFRWNFTVGLCDFYRRRVFEG